MPEPEDKRPKGCKFWIAADVVDWIKANTTPDQYGEVRGCNSAEMAARWWKANIDAEVYRDMNLREMAEMLLDGQPAITLDDVSDELQAAYLNEPSDPVAETDEEVESALGGFFLVD